MDKGPNKDFILLILFHIVALLSFLKTVSPKWKDILLEEFRNICFRDVKPQGLPQSLHNSKASLAFKS